MRNHYYSQIKISIFFKQTRQKLKNNISIMYYCPFCQAAYKHNGAWLRKHVLSCSLNSQDCKPDVKSKIACSICRREYVSTKTFETHFSKFHAANCNQINQCSQTDDSVQPINHQNLLNQSIATEHIGQVTLTEYTQSNEQVKKPSNKFFVGLIVGLVIGSLVNLLIPTSFFDQLWVFGIIETIFICILWIPKCVYTIVSYYLMIMHPLLGVAITAIDWMRELI